MGVHIEGIGDECNAWRRSRRTALQRRKNTTSRRKTEIGDDLGVSRKEERAIVSLVLGLLGLVWCQD